MKKGFTIIEMVIVIAIIGILAAVLIPTYGNVVANANESAALQTARSTMTNWLATSTTSAGVPTSGTDSNGNQFYAAYFEYSNDSGTTYQFRYTSGGVERTDDNASYYVDFSAKPQAAPAYLATPLTDSNWDSTSYAVSVYKITVGTTDETAGTKASTNYYIKQGAKSAYTCGGADVYAATSAKQVFYTCADTSAITKVSEFTWKEAAADGEVTNVKKGDIYGTKGSTTVIFTKCVAEEYTAWTEASSDNSSQQSGGVDGLKISFNTYNCISNDKYYHESYVSVAQLTTANGGKITLPTQITINDELTDIDDGYVWYTDATCTTKATNSDVYSAAKTLYLGWETQFTVVNGGTETISSKCTAAASVSCVKTGDNQATITLNFTTAPEAGTYKVRYNGSGTNLLGEFTVSGTETSASIEDCNLYSKEADDNGVITVSGYVKKTT